MKLFLDLDGVLADMHGGYESRFGKPLTRVGPDPDDLWDNIRRTPNFWLHLQPMPDAFDLWDGARRWFTNPTILSGVPKETTAPGAAQQKRAWVAQHFGSGVPVITCQSKHKYLYGKPGDILVDDWSRYKHLWETMGGTFLLHTSAAGTLAHLELLAARSS